METQTEEVADLPPLIRFRNGHNLIPTHDDILKSDPTDFARKFKDIGANNLACAIGLPGTDELDIFKMLTTIDKMAETAKQWTEKNWRLFRLNPKEYHNSENIFRVIALTHVVCKHYGVHYNPERQRPYELGGGTDMSKLTNGGDTGDLFIHAALGSRKTGLCGTIPVLMVAVGRRLGYPLYLVKIPDHLFFRWHDAKERFNVESTPGSGSVVRPDEYYRKWPEEYDPEFWKQRAPNGYRWLDSMSAEFEMARFISNRIIALRYYRRYEEALAWIAAIERYHGLPYDEWRCETLTKFRALHGDVAVVDSFGTVEGELLTPKLSPARKSSPAKRRTTAPSKNRQPAVIARTVHPVSSRPRKPNVPNQLADPHPDAHADPQPGIRYPISAFPNQPALNRDQVAHLPPPPHFFQNKERKQ